MAVVSPDTTTVWGLLFVALLCCWFKVAMSVWTVLAGCGMEAIAPCPDSSATRLLRTATIWAASGRESAPVMWAAAISPWLWPMTASGWTPWWRQSFARETIMANSAGCTMSTVSMGVWPRMTSSSDQLMWGASAVVYSVIASAFGGVVSSSSRPMPVHWLP